MLDLNTCLSW